MVCAALRRGDVLSLFPGLRPLVVPGVNAASCLHLTSGVAPVGLTPG